MKMYPGPDCPFSNLPYVADIMSGLMPCVHQTPNVNAISSPVRVKGDELRPLATSGNQARPLGSRYALVRHRFRREELASDPSDLHVSIQPFERPDRDFANYRVIRRLESREI